MFLGQKTNIVCMSAICICYGFALTLIVVAITIAGLIGLTLSAKNSLCRFFKPALLSA